MELKINNGPFSYTESASIEFKEAFDTSSVQDWCEIIKDIVAIANTDGGVIVFGLKDNGEPIEKDISHLFSLDPADVTNKIHKYTNFQFAQFELHICEKSGHKLLAMAIQHVLLPIVFEKPGTYDIGGGRQKTAFSAGTVYFRHGAKSEPGNTHDIRNAFEKG
ncbi:MAG TPA: ATP-binding protein, partial [Anaerolineae bacterium]|nr:ATP-binding protein [Anaerolineae bacterium]